MLKRLCFLVFLSISSFLWCNDQYIKTGRIPQRSPYPIGACYFLPYNPIIIEIGAGSGKITAQLATIREKSTVYSFESNIENFKKLEQNTQKFENVYIYPFGIGARNGPYPFYTPIELISQNRLNDLDKTPSMLSSILAPATYLENSYKYQRTNIQCENLQEWCQNNHIHKIDLLYLDACGYELEILQSSMGIANTAIAIFVTTYHGSFWREQGSFNSINSLLERSGYTLYTHWYEQGGKGTAFYLKTVYYKGVYERKLL